MRPAIQTWRKLKEVQVNALYMESDPAGEVARRWLHWGVSDAAALDLNNKTLQMEAEFSRSLFEGKDERYGRFGTWAKMPNGKKHYTLTARRHFVNKWKTEIYDDPELVSGLEKTSQDEDWILRLANSQVHPTIGSHERIMSIPILVTTAALAVLDILVSLKFVSLRYPSTTGQLSTGEFMQSYPPSLEFLAPLWDRVYRTFQELQTLILRALNE